MRAQTYLKVDGERYKAQRAEVDYKRDGDTLTFSIKEKLTITCPASGDLNEMGILLEGEIEIPLWSGKELIKQNNFLFVEDEK